jgi:hypothetical protein
MRLRCIVCVATSKCASLRRAVRSSLLKFRCSSIIAAHPAETSKRVLAKIKYALSHGVVNRFLQVRLLELFLGPCLEICAVRLLLCVFGSRRCAFRGEFVCCLSRSSAFLPLRLLTDPFRPALRCFSHDSQTSPHIVLLDAQFSHSMLKRPLAEWVLLWLKSKVGPYFVDFRANACCVGLSWIASWLGSSHGTHLASWTSPLLPRRTHCDVCDLPTEPRVPNVPRQDCA